MLQSEKEKLLHLEDEFHKRVVGQDEAIAAVSDAVGGAGQGCRIHEDPLARLSSLERQVWERQNWPGHLQNFCSTMKA